MIRARQALAALAGAAYLCAPAQADAGFLLPNAFHQDAPGKVNAAASFSDTFPLAGTALKSEHFAVETPGGETSPFDRQAEFATSTVLEATLSVYGTVRLTTGERLGRKGEVALLDGRYVRLGADGIDKASLPKNTKVLTSQTATVSEAYVTTGDTPDAFAFSNTARLALEPLQHPGKLKAGDTFRVRTNFDGAPIRTGEGGLIPAFSHLNGRPDGAPLSPGETGLLTLGPLDAGVYVLLVRHIARAPDGADTDVRSYSTTLTFEVGAAP